MMRRTFARLLTLAILACLCGLPGTTKAQTAWVGDAQAAVRLIAATTTTGTEASVQLGLQFRLAPGWHGYWRTPGDAGFPATVDWSGSDNLKQASLSWPLPQRFTLLGFKTLGYEHGYVLPVAIDLAKPGQELLARATVDYLACAEICVPYHAELALALPSGPASPSAEAGLIAEARTKVPGDLAALSASVAAVEVSRLTDSSATLSIKLKAEPPLRLPDLLVEGLPPGSTAGEPTVIASSGPDVTLSATVYKATAETLTKKPLTLTLVSQGRAAEFTAQPVIGKAADGLSRLLGIIGFAVLGGLILNLMPCVLPVLSLKLLSLIRYGGAERREIRVGLLATAAGILTSFLLLAGGLIGLKAAGHAVGWGLQFQQPGFIGFMVLLLVVFALSMIGRLELGLPGFLGAIGSATSRHKTIDAFLGGVFATLLATPCSAPFVGTALGFALAGGAVEISAIFTALGLGFAAPYLLAAAFPGFARFLPRPGAWMNKLRFGLGLLLAASALWLIFVLAGIVGWPSALWFTGVVALAAGLLVLGHGRGLQVAAGLAGAAALALVITAEPGARQADPSGVWKRFDEAEIPGLVAAGQIVVVDVTADWCLSCKVNKSLVLDRGAVLEALRRPGVSPRLADWTRPDPAISAYLAKFGRYGIPFNAVYGPASPNGVALPELLTEQLVLDAIAEAGGPAAGVAGK